MNLFAAKYCQLFVISEQICHLINPLTPLNGRVEKNKLNMKDKAVNPK